MDLPPLDASIDAIANGRPLGDVRRAYHARREADPPTAEATSDRTRGPLARRAATLPATGAGPDYRTRTQSQWLRRLELSRELDEEHVVVGSIIDRAVTQTLQGGMQLDCQTGDQKLDADIEQWWYDWATNPDQVDAAGEQTFAEIEHTTLRSVFVDGDVFVLPLASGHVQMIEAHLVRDPDRGQQDPATQGRIVHGVEVDRRTHRRLAYHVITDPGDPLQPVSARTRPQRVAARNGDGLRMVYHIMFPRRPRQTRGHGALKPVFDTAEYFDDIQFLKLVQARVTSLFGFVRQRAANFDPEYLAAEQMLGAEAEIDQVDRAMEARTARQRLAEVAPGAILEGLPGETLAPWSSNTPNPEWFPHAAMLLQLIGVNLGMPLVMVLMDAKETNFSGWRGAVDQARDGFRANQRRLVRRLHEPLFTFQLLRRAAAEPAFARVVERSRRPAAKVNAFNHRWNFPQYPYVDPFKDAAADLLRLSNMQTSPRRYSQERGGDWYEIAQETVQDRAFALRLALVEAQQIKDEFGIETPLDALAWRLAPLPMPERVNVSLSMSEQRTDAAPAPPAGEEAE